MCVALLWNVRSIIGNPSVAVGADLSRPRIWMYPRNGERKRIFDNVKTRIWWNWCVHLIMLGYGRDESAPTPCGVFRCTFRGWMWTFCGVFVGCFCGVHWYFAECSQRYCNPLAAKWQSVSSRRGPIYRARIYECTHEMGNVNGYLIMWKCVFGEIDVCIWLCKDTGTMNRPLRLTECFVAHFVGECGHFAEC